MKERANRIAMQWMPAAELGSSGWLCNERTLGIASFGGTAPPTAADLPRAHLRTPMIDGGTMCELWIGRHAARTETIGATRCRYNGELLFATVSIAPEQDDGDSDDSLGAATYVAYRSLLDALQSTGYPHVLRVWNSIPDINVDNAGLERYRRFNVQRFRAYQESHRPTHTGAPAACALGSVGGPLVLYCLASKEPAESIENPRQVSAYQYPQQYRPRAPNFSRAALWHGSKDRSESDVLFISGTASIVGHQTLHAGDVAAQTRETLANLESVLAEAERVAGRPIATLSQMSLKAYVRRIDDVPHVHRELSNHGLDAGAVLYLNADICRAELLMEIDAIGPATAIRIETAGTRDSASRPSSDSQALQETG